MKTKIMQIVRLVVMIIALAGIIFAVEYVKGNHRWFWVALLAVGFVGLLYNFRITQRRLRRERRARKAKEEMQQKRRERKAKRRK